MEPLTALGVLGAVVGAAAVLGLVLRRREGRVRAASPGARATPASLDVDPATFGARATLVQFGTAYCTRCPATRRVLGGIAHARHGVAHVDVDLTDRPDLTRRFGVLQTPTTLIVDPDGAVRARIGGSPRAHDVTRELDRLLEETHV
ncbi:TlpA family protein disulfide reductase [Microbacterium sp. JZ31]|uniref:TlpA family protein disulfide reductase n=1 Tax=Microbacterium sp. JZ31 TaxID=1906274 RepID=UPI0019318649|nr:thioredoxin family protein [Microbacterium sp. JZ31]